MKILISIYTLDKIRDNKEVREKWNVDRILIWGTGLTESLEQLPRSDEELTFLIPTVIDVNNALAYDGANLALRILFKYVQIRTKGINVVLLGFETTEAFLRHYSYPNILKIPGFSYCLFNRKVVSRLKQKEAPTHRTEYKSYIQSLGLSLPSSFKSTHSLTNEWSLYKWNSYLEMPSSESATNLNLMYVDYIKVIEKINNVKDKKLKNNTSMLERINNLRNLSAKILLIDDNVGWHKFFHSFFKGSNIQFEAIGEEFRKKDINAIEKIISEKVDEFLPDVILLDFRLIEDKDAESKFKDISGTMILQALKGSFEKPGSSFGRQVLMFTATSRIENILRLKQLNADGFILKENPAQYAAKELTRDLLSKMMRDLTTAIGRAKFLIRLNDELSGLTAILCNESGAGSPLSDIIITTSKSIRLITQNNKLNFDVLKLVFLNLFSILEVLKPKDIKNINTFIQGASPNHILGDWNNIDNLRNALAHGDSLVYIDNRKLEVREDLIKAWSLRLCQFIKEFLYACK